MHSRRPHGRLLSQHLTEDAIERFGERQLFGWRELANCVEAWIIPVRVGNVTGERLVQHNAQGEDIGGRTDYLGMLELLRGTVQGSTDIPKGSIFVQC